MAIFDRHFNSCLADALEDCPNVPGEVRSHIGGDSNVAHVLSTLASLKDWVQVHTHET